MKRRGKLLTWVALLAWGAALGYGQWRMADFENEPAPPAAPPSHWPAASTIAVAPAVPVALLFVHPMCPCTRATLAELERLLARSGGDPSARAEVRVVVVWDDATEPDWNACGTWDAAKAISGITVSTDLGGVEARRFGATTSGEVMFYGRDRALRFHGGITAARGHEGDNAGATALQALLAGDAPEVVATPVFGCPLFTRRAS